MSSKNVKHQDSNRQSDNKKTLFAMCHSNQPEEPTSPRLMHFRWLICMCVIAVRAGDSRRGHGIEMNEARETYLKNYSAVDKIDQMLLGWDSTYRSWRWWHAPTRHAKATAMSMAYSLYLQCAKGTVDPEWKVTPVSGPRFGRRCLFRWYSTNVQTYTIQGMKRCARILR